MQTEQSPAATPTDIRSLLLSKSTMRTFQLEVPELGRTVTLRELTAGDRQELEYQTKINGKGIVEVTVALSLLDENGQRAFQMTDLDALSKLPAAMMFRMFKAVFDFCGLGPQEAEEAEKN